MGGGSWRTHRRQHPSAACPAPVLTSWPACLPACFPCPAPALPCTCTALPWTAQPCLGLHSPALPCTALPVRPSLPNSLPPRRVPSMRVRQRHRLLIPTRCARRARHRACSSSSPTASSCVAASRPRPSCRRCATTWIPIAQARHHGLPQGTKTCKAPALALRHHGLPQGGGFARFVGCGRRS